MTKIIFDPFERAINSLGAALFPPPINDRERDGAIQRYEYCLELAWKTGQKVLSLLGVTANSPKGVFRALGAAGIVDNVQEWLDYVDLSTKTSHIYREEVAQDVYSHIEPFFNDLLDLVSAYRKAVASVQDCEDENSTPGDH